MQQPVNRQTIITFLVWTSFISAIVLTPVLVHDSSVKSFGNVKPFCPEFSVWLKSPGVNPGNNDPATHGLGLIPAPVSLVGSSPGISAGIQRAGNPVFPVLSSPVAKFPSFHPAFFSV
jgi:hypothetical protein